MIKSIATNQLAAVCTTLWLAGTGVADPAASSADTGERAAHAEALKMHLSAAADGGAKHGLDVEVILANGRQEIKAAEARAAELLRRAAEQSGAAMNQNGPSVTTISFSDTNQAGTDVLDTAETTGREAGLDVVTVDDVKPEEDFRDNISRPAAWVYDKAVLLVRMAGNYAIGSYVLIQIDNVSAADAAFIAGIAVGMTALLHVTSDLHSRFLNSDKLFSLLPNPSKKKPEYDAAVAAIKRKCRESKLYQMTHQGLTYFKDGIVTWVFLKVYWLAKVHVGIIDVPVTPMDWAFNELMFIGGTMTAMFVESGFLIWASKLINDERERSPASRNTYLNLKQKTYFFLASILLTPAQIMLAGISNTAHTLYEIPQIGLTITPGVLTAVGIGVAGLITYTLEFSDTYRVPGLPKRLWRKAIGRPIRSDQSACAASF